jgi:hypothetical protein
LNTLYHVSNNAHFHLKECFLVVDDKKMCCIFIKAG